MTHAEKEVRNQKIVALRRQGYSQSQLAEMFGLTNIYAICKRYGVAGVMSDRKAGHHSFGGNQYTKRTEEEKREYVESLLPFGFSYEGGYIDCDHKVMIKCNVCNTEFERSMVSIRQGKKTVCPCCALKDKEYKQQMESALEEEQRQRREEAREQRALEEAKRKEDKHNQMLHPCLVCGNITANKKYCSMSCGKKANNNRKETRRRAKIKDALVDSDIDLHTLFDIDKGRCYICGGECDWNDKETRPGGIVCGDLYPSIDHVIPLAKGGKHEWGNVKLAHRICNSKKAASISPWVKTA